jgi:hypothetical protein
MVSSASGAGFIEEGKMNRNLSFRAIGGVLAAAALFMVSDAHAAVNKRVSIVNESDQNIVAFRATHSYDTIWRSDLLGDYVIHPGYHMVIDMDDGRSGCQFDFKTRMANGQEFVRYNVNVCRIDSYTITSD